MRDYYNKTCELCKTPVRVVGDVTHFYVSAYDEIVKAHDELVTIIKSMQQLCHDVEPEMNKLEEQNKILREALAKIANQTGYTMNDEEAKEALAKCNNLTTKTKENK